MDIRPRDTRTHARLLPSAEMPAQRPWRCYTQRAEQQPWTLTKRKPLRRTMSTACARSVAALERFAWEFASPLVLSAFLLSRTAGSGHLLGRLKSQYKAGSGHLLGRLKSQYKVLKKWFREGTCGHFRNADQQAHKADLPYEGRQMRARVCGHLHVPRAFSIKCVLPR